MAKNPKALFEEENLSDVIKTVMGIRIKCELEGVRKFFPTPSLRL